MKENESYCDCITLSGSKSHVLPSRTKSDIYSCCKEESDAISANRRVWWSPAYWRKSQVKLNSVTED